MEQYQPPKEVKTDSDLPENARIYIGKERFKIFLLAAGAGMLLMYLYFATTPTHIEHPQPYIEEYLRTCDLYNICNYTRPLFCPSIDCKPEYGCWIESRNCTKDPK
jgi:hypothetical protein